MFQIQLRYFQYVLSLAIFIGILISSKPLVTACFVGLTLVWLTEMLIGQFDLKSEQYYVILTVLLISFSTIAFQSIFSEINKSILLITCVLISVVYFLFQQNINIFKIGTVFMNLIITFLVNGFIILDSFQENIFYISYLFLLLLFLKTLATYFNIQFSNFQFFFNFFVVSVVFIGVSSFYSYNIINVFLAGLTTALFTTLLTFLFVKIRFEYEFTTQLSNQIYIFDFLFAFVASLYFVDSLNVVNGLF
jgi:hypothetical protein|tara:strand:+ start:12 stop:758 length:747 start_codon:yes stop_codon:yes gene_type:complete